MAAKIAPFWPVVFGVSRSFPEPWASVLVGQLPSGVPEALPAAVRQASLVPDGSDTAPAGPSTLLSWNGWLNSTVPAAEAPRADAVSAAAAATVSSTAAAARAPRPLRPLLTGPRGRRAGRRGLRARPAAVTRPASGPYRSTAAKIRTRPSSSPGTQMAQGSPDDPARRSRSPTRLPRR